MINEENFISGSNDGALALWHISKKKPLFVVNKSHFIENNTNSNWISSVAAFHNTDLLASGSILTKLKMKICFLK